MGAETLNAKDPFCLLNTSASCKYLNNSVTVYIAPSCSFCQNAFQVRVMEAHFCITQACIHCTQCQDDWASTIMLLSYTHPHGNLSATTQHVHMKIRC